LPLGAEQPPADGTLSDDDSAAPGPDGAGAGTPAGEAGADDPAPSEPLPPGFVGVAGTIVDRDTGTPLEGARVVVVDGGTGAAETDRAGRYRLPLPPGRYQLRVYYPIYQIRRIRNVVVGGRARIVDVVLASDEGAIEQILVEAEPERRTEAGLLQIRKRAATVSDSLSAQEMSRSPDSAASDAAKRVLSVTGEDGKYVLIPGLGDRYVTTLLNRAPLPSTEPDRQAVPLDLFPTSLLANLSIHKSYSAEYPASFAGGTMLIESTDYPDDLTIKLKVGTSGDTESTGEDAPTYDGGGLDFFGYDDGKRALPDSVPRDGPAVMGNSTGLDASDMENIGESFDNAWSSNSRNVYPNLSVGATIGDTVRAGAGDVGYIGALSFAHKMTSRKVEWAKIRPIAGEVEGFEVREDRALSKGVEKGSVGALAATGWKPSPDQQVDLFAMYVHEGEDVTQREAGVNRNGNQEIEGTRFFFVERSMAFAQLSGRHFLRRLGNVELRWQGNASRVSRDEPDTRNLVYGVVQSTGALRASTDPSSGSRFFSSLGETGLGGSLGATVPLGRRFTLNTGGDLMRAERSFSARRFSNSWSRQDTAALFLPPDQIFAAEQIGTNFELQERTLQNDAYEASQWIAAGYALGGVELARRLRLYGGLRYEANKQELTPGSPYGTNAIEEDDFVDRSDRSWAPSSSAVLALTDEMNLRAAYSYTLARPRFREIAPFLFTDYTRSIDITGNADLVETRIHNADLRWEWFAEDTDVFAASAFYKDFRDPIELTLEGVNGDSRFVNARGARAAGLELEARVSLGRLHDSLRELRLWTNATLSRTRIELREEDVNSQTSGSRPLQGQAPIVVNLGASWSHPDSGTEVTGLYNVVGRRIEEVGSQGLPNTYREPFHQVDIAASQRLGGDFALKLGASNLLNQSEVLRQGGIQVFRQSPGVAVSAALEWTP